MSLRNKCFCLVFLGIMITVLSCSEEKLPVKIIQNTDPSHITAITVHDGAIYCATKGGLVRWNLPEKKYTIYTTADGLPSNVLNDVIVDSKNRLCVASTDGVGIFDGTSWTHYGKDSGLQSNEINSLSMDNDGGLWASTKGGIAKFERGRFTAFTEERGPAGIDVNCILFDKGNNVWVGTADNGVYIKMKDKWTRTGSRSGLITDAASTIVQSWDNSIWAASWAGISRWDGFGWSAFKPMKRLKTYKAREMLATENRLWYFTANGVHSSRGSDWGHYTEEDGLISNDVICGHIVSDDLIYVGTTYGLSVIDNGVIENYAIPNKHFGNNCISVVIDESNRAWVGTWETGLNMYDSGYWVKITEEKSDILATVRSTVFGPDGMTVFNTTGGIAMKDDSGWRVYTRNDGVSSNDVRCGVYDTEGRYWVGTSTGLSCLSKGKWKRYREIHGLPSEDIWSCALDSEGTLWFGTTDGIVSYADSLTDRTPETGLESPDVRSILTVGDMVYFGTESGKVLVFDHENDNDTWNVFGNKFLDTDKGIYSIAEGASGSIWFGTNGDGIIHLKDGMSYKYVMEDGLSSNFVRAVAYRDGVLWAACYGGVSIIEVEGD